ncbi:hypothetical protein MGU_10915 [Metarhizium guizhouense ARSEF 977]|uniref:SnoaL-like domain-containing protein n=1 Tax=Metarhizium guizhouense (strain ARSEF 977) TaxID=1276136 RepID=A0A0B4GPR3_METGA|nr:hypothetical protein MGU_10915 [Metarhizium guizhouense ARSEF 977]
MQRMNAATFRHTGDWNAASRQNRALRFIESYAKEVASDIGIQYSATKYYAPSCVFFDTTNVKYNGANDIKAWMQRLFSSFDKIEFTGLTFLVIEEGIPEHDTPIYTVNAEFMAKYYVKGDPEPVSVPRLFIFTIGQSESEDGFDGLQYLDVKLYWDTSLVKEKILRRRITSVKDQDGPVD